MNPIMLSIAQIEIAQFDEETEWAYYEMVATLGPERTEEIVRSFEPDIIKWREFCIPGTPDVDHAFLICLTDRLDNPDAPEESARVKKIVQATLHWMRINGTIV